MDRSREFPLSKESFAYMKMLAGRVGIDIADYREEAVYTRLAKRLRTLKLPDFDAYCLKLKTDLEEEIKFINLITNVTTAFFREPHHFEYFASHQLKKLIVKKKKIRIWTAGCATGEEAYSIAIVIREVIPNLENYDIKILATDVNSDALLTAESGIYEFSQIRKMSLVRQKAWFHRIGSRDSRWYKVQDSLKDLISFRQLNLADIWPMRGPFDVIFCRNVLIYLKPEIKHQVLLKFTKMLGIGGVLILGHSESLYALREHYVPVGKTIYKKIR